jgi:hypothetical protein
MDEITVTLYLSATRPEAAPPMIVPRTSTLDAPVDPA